MELEGAVVIVTGASSGIGRATAVAASRAGAEVALLARREDRVSAIAADLPNALAVRCDVTVQEDVDAAVRDVISRFGRIDVLVNNAGQSLTAGIEETDLTDFQAILELNLVAPLRVMQAVLPAMKQQHAGSIVNVSSGTTLSPYVGTGAYSASKAGLEQLGAVARAELADSGITVSTVLPSLTRTDLLEAARGTRRGNYDLQGAQAPEQVADVILALVRSGGAIADLVPAEYGGTYRA